MPRRIVDLRGPRALLDIASHGRAGQGLSAARRDAIARITRRAPEVVIKVSGGGRSIDAVKAHLRYIGRHGRLALSPDEGDEISSTLDVKDLIADWGLRTEALQRRQRYSGRTGIKGAKITHNIVFSMPAGTSSKKVLAAVEDFAHEQWALEHRYAMVLHTDTPRPHVHVVVKAMSEQGRRLIIGKELLRAWRREFARHLRERGVDANATSRATRGGTGRRLMDRIYRAAQRGESTFLLKRSQQVAKRMRESRGRNDEQIGQKRKLQEFRRRVEEEWRSEQAKLRADGEIKLAADIDWFVMSMPAPQTESDLVTRHLQTFDSIRQDFR